MQKKAEFGFVWIFAILAGTAILLLMIYGATRALDTERTITDTKLAVKLISELDPLETSSESSISATISLPNPTNISISCFDLGYGDNRIQISTKSSRGSNSWSTGEEIVVKDKYIFSDSVGNLNQLEINSKPFSYPYKIADLIFITSNNYCFKNAPPKIKNEYGILRGIYFDNCSSDQISVCFDTYGCNISVNGRCNDADCGSLYDYGSVTKDEETFFYADSLMLGAIISSKQNYECNVKRLMYRGSKIAEILIKKGELASSRGCHTTLTQYLELFKTQFLVYSPGDFISDAKTVIEINKINDGESCGLW
jgi:hypothetical protein